MERSLYKVSWYSEPRLLLAKCNEFKWRQNVVLLERCFCIYVCDHTQNYTIGFDILKNIKAADKIKLLWTFYSYNVLSEKKKYINYLGKSIQLSENQNT